MLEQGFLVHLLMSTAARCLTKRGDLEMGKLEGKVAVITASTRSIGRAIAEIYLSEGAKVVVSGRSAEKGEQLAASDKTRKYAMTLPKMQRLGTNHEGEPIQEDN